MVFSRYFLSEFAEHTGKTLSFPQMVQTFMEEQRVKPIFEALLEIKSGEVLEGFEERLLAGILGVFIVRQNI